MATSYDLFFTGDQSEAKRQLGVAFEKNGFTVQARPDGNWVAARGSAAATFWLGAMAGKNFRLTFEVTFYSAEDGGLIARFNRNVAGGALRGGAIGAARAGDAFNATYSALVADLQPGGILTRTTANN